MRESIDSDLDNFAFLGQTLGLAPRGVNLEPILTLARRQLHQEADYLAEADALEAYGALIGDDPDLLVPKVHRDLSSTRVLAMDFATGIPVDQLTGPAFRQVDRDHAATLLERIFVGGRELFYEDAFGRKPEPATFFLHRKFVGIFMLCRRLRARVDLNELTAAYG